MLPEWWLQFDRRFLESRAAAFAGRLAQGRGPASFLSAMEPRLARMLTRSGWLESFLVRGPTHDSGLAFGYDDLAAPEFNWLTLEDELDDLNEEAALSWLRRVAPSHPVARRLQSMARATPRGTAAATKSGRAAKPGSRAVAAAPNASGRRVALEQARRGASPVAGPHVAGAGTQKAIPRQDGAVDVGALQGPATVPSLLTVAEELRRAEVSPGVLPIDQSPEVRTPALSLAEVAGLPGAEAVYAVLRDLSGAPDENIEAGVTPRSLLFALLQQRRTEAGFAPRSHVHAEAGDRAERVWLQSSDEAGSEPSTVGARVNPAERARRIAPLSEVRFAEALAMAPGLREMSGLLPRRAQGVSGASGPAADVPRSRQEFAAASELSAVLDRSGASELRRVALEGARPATSLHRMIGGTSARGLHSTPLLRALFNAPTSTESSSALFAADLLGPSDSRLSAIDLGSASERFVPVSFGWSLAERATNGPGAAESRDGMSARGEERVWLQSGPDAAPEAGDEGALARSARPPRSTSSTKSVSKASKMASDSDAGSGHRVPDVSDEASTVVGRRPRGALARIGLPMPALVDSLRRALEAREGVSTNLDAFARLTEVISRQRAVSRADHARTGAERVVARGPGAAEGGLEPVTAAATDVAAGRVAAGGRLPIGFASTLRGPKAHENESFRPSDADGTPAARPAGSRRAAVKLSGLMLDENGLPQVGRGSHTRSMAPLSESLALLAASESESPESGARGHDAAGERVATKAAVDAVREAIATWERRVAAAKPRVAGDESAPRAESPGPLGKKGRGAKSTVAQAASAAPTAGAKRPVGGAKETSSTGPSTTGPSTTTGFESAPVSAPNAATWSRLGMLAKAMLGDDDGDDAGVVENNGFIAALAARLGVTAVTPEALREAVEAASAGSMLSSTSAGREAVGATPGTPGSRRSFERVRSGGSLPTSISETVAAGSTRALAFGDRVLSAALPPSAASEIGASGRGAAYESQTGDGALAYVGLATSDDGGEAREERAPGRRGRANAARTPEKASNRGLTSIAARRAGVDAFGAAPLLSPAETVAVRARLVAALRSVVQASPSVLAPQAIRLAAELGARVSGGRALSAVETGVVLSTLRSAGLENPSGLSRLVEASSGTLPAVPSVTSAAWSRAEAWQDLPALRASASPVGSESPGVVRGGVAAPSSGGVAALEGLRFHTVERLTGGAGRLGGNLSTWLQEPNTGDSDVGSGGRGSAVQVVPGLAGRTLGLAGWSLGNSGESAWRSAGSTRPGNYPEAASTEWLSLAGSDETTGGGAQGDVRSSVVDKTAGASRDRGTGGAARVIPSGSARALTRPEGARESVRLEAGRAVRTLGPNLGSWLAPRAVEATGAPTALRTPGARSELRASTFGLASAGSSANVSDGAVGEWLRLERETPSSVDADVAAPSRFAATARGTSAGLFSENLSVPMAERLQQTLVAMGAASLASDRFGSGTSEAHGDLARLGGSVLDLVSLAGEAVPEGWSGESGKRAKGRGQASRGATSRATSSRGGERSAGTGRGSGSSATAFAPLDATRVAGLRSRVGGWLASVYQSAAMSGALHRGRALEGFASLLQGGGPASEAAREFSMLDPSAAMTFLDFVGEGASSAATQVSTDRTQAYRPGTRQPVGRRPEGGVGPTVVTGPRGAGEAIGAPGVAEVYAAQSRADLGAFVETPSAFRRDASAFFAETAGPAAEHRGGLGTGGLSLPLVSPVVNVVSEAASFSQAGSPRAGGASVREEVTTNVERVSKGRDESEKELRKVLPELVEMLRRRMRTERERRGLL